MPEGSIRAAGAGITAPKKGSFAQDASSAAAAFLQGIEEQRRAEEAERLERAKLAVQERLAGVEERTITLEEELGPRKTAALEMQSEANKLGAEAQMLQAEINSARFGQETSLETYSQTLYEDVLQMLGIPAATAQLGAAEDKRAVFESLMRERVAQLQLEGDLAQANALTDAERIRFLQTERQMAWDAWASGGKPMVDEWVAGGGMEPITAFATDPITNEILTQDEVQARIAAGVYEEAGIDPPKLMLFNELVDPLDRQRVMNEMYFKSQTYGSPEEEEIARQMVTGHFQTYADLMRTSQEIQQRLSSGLGGGSVFIGGGGGFRQPTRVIGSDGNTYEVPRGTVGQRGSVDYRTNSARAGAAEEAVARNLPVGHMLGGDANAAEVWMSFVRSLESNDPTLRRVAVGILPKMAQDGIPVDQLVESTFHMTTEELAAQVEADYETAMGASIRPPQPTPEPQKSASQTAEEVAQNERKRVGETIRLMMKPGVSSQDDLETYIRTVVSYGAIDLRSALDIVAPDPGRKPRSRMTYRERLRRELEIKIQTRRAGELIREGVRRSGAERRRLPVERVGGSK